MFVIILAEAWLCIAMLLVMILLAVKASHSLDRIMESMSELSDSIKPYITSLEDELKELL